MNLCSILEKRTCILLGKTNNLSMQEHCTLDFFKRSSKKNWLDIKISLYTFVNTYCVYADCRKNHINVFGRNCINHSQEKEFWFHHANGYCSTYAVSDSHALWPLRAEYLSFRNCLVAGRSLLPSPIGKPQHTMQCLGSLSKYGSDFFRGRWSGDHLKCSYYWVQTTKYETVWLCNSW